MSAVMPSVLTDNSHSDLTSQPPTRSCEICDDGWVVVDRDERGYIKAMRPCDCQKAMRIARRIPAKYRGATLTDFKEHTLEFIGDWLKDFRSPGLFIFGRPGAGKTHLAVAIVRSLLDSSEASDAICRRASTLYSKIRATFNGDVPEEAVMREHVEIPLLLLDDVAAGSCSDFERRVLLDILDRRATRRTIITSNASVEDLGKLLDERIASRLREFAIFHHGGADRRGQRN